MLLRLTDRVLAALIIVFGIVTVMRLGDDLWHLRWADALYCFVNLAIAAAVSVATHRKRRTRANLPPSGSS